MGMTSCVMLFFSKVERARTFLCFFLGFVFTAMASNLEAMAWNLIAKLTTLIRMASNPIAMASNLIAKGTKINGCE